MFDPIPPARLVAMLGELLRESARWDRPLDEFQSSQLLSASSIARYLAAEMEGAGARLAEFAGAVDAALAAAETIADAPDWRQALTRARARFAGDSAATGDPALVARELGAAGLEVLQAARRTDDPGGARFADSFRAVLAELANQHVDLLGATARAR